MKMPKWGWWALAGVGVAGVGGIVLYEETKKSSAAQGPHAFKAGERYALTVTQGSSTPAPPKAAAQAALDGFSAGSFIVFDSSVSGGSAVITFDCIKAVTIPVPFSQSAGLTVTIKDLGASPILKVSSPPGGGVTPVSGKAVPAKLTWGGTASMPAQTGVTLLLTLPSAVGAVDTGGTGTSTISGNTAAVVLNGKKGTITISAPSVGGKFGVKALTATFSVY